MGRIERPDDDVAEVVQEILADATFSPDGGFMVRLGYRHRMQLARFIVSELRAEGFGFTRPPA